MYIRIIVQWKPSRAPKKKKKKAVFAYLVVRKTVQQTTLINVVKLDDDITIASTTGSGDNILVERKRDKHHDGEEVYGGADGAHALGDLVAVVDLAHVAAAKASLHKGRSEPADHGEAEGKGEHREAQEGDEGFAIALEGVCEDCDGCAG